MDKDNENKKMFAPLGITAREMLDHMSQYMFRARFGTARNLNTF